MCTKTKTSFGCGHCIKKIEDCGVPNCRNLDKWKLPKDMDCVHCYLAGQASTRGKDGRGQHGREQARHRESRQSSADVLYPITNDHGTPNLAISPWARDTPEVSQEKLWNTPTRIKADDAWVIEHARRMSELEEKKSKVSSRSTSRVSRKSTPRASHERFLEVTEVFEEPEDLVVTPSQSNLLPYEIEEASRTYSNPSNRKLSHDSIGSGPYYQDGPGPLVKSNRRKAHPVTPISEYNSPVYHEPRRSRRSGSKTEPYYAQSCSFESPMPRNHPTQENWMNQYEVIQPVYHDPYYTRSHQVY